MKKLLLILCYVFAAVPAFTQVIPLDSRVKKGTLPNGLTYYIMPNQKPEKKVELRLVVNAGSILEDEDQQGLAHFLEHMLFNGTKNFKKNELVDYLQTIGVKFGADLNAYTSFDETVYILPIPTEKPEIVEKGFQVLEDWAHNALLEESEIDKERGVVLEEYRLGLGADKRMWERYLPIVLKNSRYAERLPIGKKEILETFKPETLRRFYRDWYRPDLMSVIVVGDMDPKVAEEMIIKHFAGIIGPENPRSRTEFMHPFVEDVRIAVESDKEAAYNTVSINYFQPGEYSPPQTENAYLEDMILTLYAIAIRERYQDIAQKPNPPFSFAGSYVAPYFSRKNQGVNFYAYFDDNKSGEAFKTLYTEILRMKKFGISEPEIDRAKKQLIAWAEKNYNDRNKTESGNIIYSLVNNFLQNTPEPGPEWTLEFLRKSLGGVTSADVNKLLATYLQTKNIAVVFELTDKAGNSKPASVEVQQWMTEIDALEITKNEEKEVNAALLNNIPIAYKGYTIKKTTAPGVQLMTLANGVKVYYKPTDFKDDEVRFQAYSPGGTSTLSKELLHQTEIGLGWISSPTLNGMNPAMLSKVTSGKYVWVGAGISEFEESISGESNKSDLEIMMQWIHLYFTSLEYNADDYAAYRDQQIGFYNNLLNNPSSYFSLQYQKILANGDPRYVGFPTAENWAKQNPEKVFAIMKEKFSNAADFTFFFAGNLEEKKFAELCETYLATLPVKSERESRVAHPWPLPTAPLDTTIYKGTEPKSSVSMMLATDIKYKPKLALHMDLIAEILEIKLTEMLREEASGVYGIGAYAYFMREPDNRFYFVISFPCGPENVDKLSRMAAEELNKILRNGPEEKDLAKVKEAKRIELDQRLKENNFWLRKMTTAVKYGDKLSDPAKAYKEIEKTKASALKKSANKYLDLPPYRFVLMPEK